MQSRPHRVLFFSPYAAWKYHTALEVTWAHALALRGADVHFVLCNGLSRACDVYRENLNPRTPISCLQCQASCAEQFLRYSMPYEWLGTYLPRSVRAEGEEWVASIPADRLLEAEWRGMPVGRWAATSSFGQFRVSELRTEEERIERIVRDFLLGTVLFTEASDVLLTELRPDTLLLLNGRFFGHWAAVELAKRQGVRFVSHERGLRTDSVRFAEGARTHELESLRGIWSRWRDVALDAQELEEITEVLEERRQGVNFSRLSFSPPVQDCGRVRAALGLDERPLVVAFNSSDDETAAFPERCAGAYPHSSDFLPAVLELARSRPQVQFVIRIHPNIQKAEAGTNQDALRHAQEVRDRAPENVSVVLPADDISSYTLIDLAPVGIVYASTIGLEMAALGKPVLCAAQATYSHTGCVRQLDDPAQLAPFVAQALERGVERESARLALRWAHRYFRECSIPFGLVHQEPHDQASLAFSRTEELQVGRSPILDRICRFLVGQEATVLPDPSPAERERSSDEEDGFLDRWLRRVAQRGTGRAPTAA